MIVIVIVIVIVMGRCDFFAPTLMVGNTLVCGRGTYGWVGGMGIMGWELERKDRA